MVTKREENFQYFISENPSRHYEELEFLGGGVFGNVFLAKDHQNNRNVAIKRIRKNSDVLSREWKILSILENKSDYIIKLYDVYYSNTKDENKEYKVQNLVFEYGKESLDDYLNNYRDNSQFIPIKIIKKIFKELMLSLEYCHSLHIVHRDLKLDNLLIGEDNKIKLADFGNAKVIKPGDQSNPCIINQIYRAPELFLGQKKYNEKIDIYTAGCILYELFTLDSLIQGKEEEDLLREYFLTLGKPEKNYFLTFDNLTKSEISELEKVKPPKTKDISQLLNEFNEYRREDIQQAAQLIKQMISWDPECRPSARKVLRHPFLQNVDLNVSLYP